MRKLYNLVTPWGTTEKVYLQKGEYWTDKTLAVSTICENGEQWGVVTVNVGEEPLNERCAFVKNYSENEGVVDFLIENKIAKPTGREFQSGFVIIPEFEFDLSKLEESDDYEPEEKEFGESEYIDEQGHDTRTGETYEANEKAWGRH